MKQTKLCLLLVALSMLSMVACAQGKPESVPDDEPENEPDLTTPSPEPAGPITSPSGTVRPVPTLPSSPPRVQPATPATNGEVPQELVDRMIDQLAAQLGTERQSITVASSEAITWNDGSLGCPKPGEFYTQALVPGYRVILEASGKQYDYHASERGYFFLCTAPLPGQNRLPGGSTPSQ